MSEIRVDRIRPELPIVTIDRRHRCNACDGAAWRDLTSVFCRLASEGGIRGAVLTGAGGHYCAGDDMKDSALKQGGSVADEYLQAIRSCYVALAACPFPIVSAISGACLGGGLSLALCCDFRIADRSAIFGVPAAKLGDFYPLENCRRLISLIGASRTKQMLYSGEPITAEFALANGLVDALTDDEVLAEAVAFISPMLDKAPLTIASVKLAVNAVVDDEVEAQRSIFDALVERIQRSEDRREGMLAFAEKRQAVFHRR